MDFNQEKNIDEKEYSIFNFFKEHTNFFVATVSAIVACISFIFNMAIYLYTSSYLSYWEIGINEIEINTNNLIYSIFATFFYSMIVLITSILISKTYSAYMPRQKNIIYSKRIEKRVKRSLRKQKNKLRKLKNRFKKLLV